MSKLYSIEKGQVISFDFGLSIDTIGHKKESIIPGKPEKEAYKNRERVNTLTNPTSHCCSYKPAREVYGEITGICVT